MPELSRREAASALMNCKGASFDPLKLVVLASGLAEHVDAKASINHFHFKVHHESPHYVLCGPALAIRLFVVAKIRLANNCCGVARYCLVVSHYA